MRVRLLLALLASLLLASCQQAPATPVVGKAAPPFQLPTLAGPSTTLAAYKGKPVILNFWATWCEPCKQEMPALQAQASHSDLEILGIDNVEPAVRVKPFVQQYGLTFPILLDQDGTVIEEYRIVGMPTSFFIDRGGVLRASFQGALTPEVLQRDLAAIGAA